MTLQGLEKEDLGQCVPSLVLIACCVMALLYSCSETFGNQEMFHILFSSVFILCYE